MSRANGGVPSKVTHNAQTGVGGQMGTTRGNGGAANQTEATPRELDQSMQRGPYGSTIQAGQGTTKDMGGVGDNKCSGSPANDFRQAH